MLTLERPVGTLLSPYWDRTLGVEEVLFDQGSLATTLYVVQTHWIKMLRASPHGRDTIVEFLIPGDIFDLPSLLDGLPHFTRASCLSGAGAQVRCYSKSQALGDPGLLAKALSQLLIRVRWQQRMFAALATERVEHRAALALCMLGERCGVASQEGMSFTLPLTRQEFGELIGTTAETAIRTFRDFVRRGWLRTEGRLITLCRLDELRDCAMC